MCKTFLLIITTLSFCISVNAQITVNNNTFPALGDTLIFAFDASPNINAFTPPGGGQTWDFSSLRVDFTQQQIFQNPTAGTASAEFPGANLLYLNGTVENYLQVTNQTVTLLGYYGTDPVGIGFNAAIRYNPPIVETRAPTNFFDINQISSGILYPFSSSVIPDVIRQQLPFTPDSLRIRIAVNRLDVVDAWGDVTIPGGTYPVLREKRTTYRETRLDAKIQPLGWLDVTDVVIQAVGLSSLGVDTTVTYNFFNNTSKEPIAIVTLNRDQATPRLVQYKTNALTTDVTQLEQENLDFSAFPNPASDKVFLGLENVKSGQYNLKIYNLLGAEVWSKSYQITGNQFNVEVDISQLETGSYFYRWLDNRGVTLVAKQLLVIK